MKSLILAAGRGSRMRHLTADRPKGLTPFNGVPLIERQCKSLRDAGATDIGIITGYMAEMFTPYADCTFHNPRWADTQMLTSLSYADAWLSQEPVIVSYSDIFYDAETVRVLAQAKTSLAISFDENWAGQWTGRFDDPLDDAETFRLRAGTGDIRLLQEIGGKPRSLDEIEGQYMGLLRFTPEAWAETQVLRSEMPQDQRDWLSMTELLNMLIMRGMDIQATACVGPWGEIDSVEDLAFFEANRTRYD